MTKNVFHALLLSIAGLLSAASITPAWAQDAPVAASPAAAPLSTSLVKTGLYLIDGGGANSLLRFSANGLLLVDGKAPGNYRALMSQVRKTSKLGDMPLRALILTAPSDDRAGNAAQFVAAHVTIIAPDDALHRLAAVAPTEGHPAPPTIGFDHDYVVRLGGVEARLAHMNNARTDSDAIVYFPDLKVVAVGDLYDTGAAEPDVAAGGSLAGWSAALAQVLALDVDTVVPSHGPVVTRADLAAFKSRIDARVAGAGVASAH